MAQNAVLFKRKRLWKPFHKLCKHLIEVCLWQQAATLNRPFEHEDRLRELCLKQQEINKLLDLDKGDAQAVANDNVPQDEPEAGTFVERLTARRTERRQVKDLEGVA